MGWSTVSIRSSRRERSLSLQDWASPEGIAAVLRAFLWRNVRSHEMPSDEQLNALAEIMCVKEYEDGTVLCQEGDPLDFCLIVIEGQVALSKSVAGQSYSVGACGPLDQYGFDVALHSFAQENCEKPCSSRSYRNLIANSSWVAIETAVCQGNLLCLTCRAKAVGTQFEVIPALQRTAAIGLARRVRQMSKAAMAANPLPLNRAKALIQSFRKKTKPSLVSPDCAQQNVSPKSTNGGGSARRTPRQRPNNHPLRIRAPSQQTKALGGGAASCLSTSVAFGRHIDAEDSDSSDQSSAPSRCSPEDDSYWAWHKSASVNVATATSRMRLKGDTKTSCTACNFNHGPMEWCPATPTCAVSEELKDSNSRCKKEQSHPDPPIIVMVALASLCIALLCLLIQCLAIMGRG
mmetsp:Transcript_4629/g.8348  ORF Transcript_4629/g.8348 Transcript_4629/m.8348 type:complete len:405 (-) Transcript_4629:1039-2253(-)